MHETIKNAVVEAVEKLKSYGLEAKVGKKGDRLYPLIREGRWSSALQWDDAQGSACDAYSRFGRPHWDFYYAPNLDKWAVEYLYALPAPIMDMKIGAAPLVAALLTGWSDPCRIPYALTTPGFVCPVCADTLDDSQKRDPLSSNFEMFPKLVPVNRRGFELGDGKYEDSFYQEMFGIPDQNHPLHFFQQTERN
jgi:hypothetical protein